MTEQCEVEPEYVVVCENEAEGSRRLELPTNATDNSLSLQTLKSAFPNAQEPGHWRLSRAFHGYGPHRLFQACRRLAEQVVRHYRESAAVAPPPRSESPMFDGGPVDAELASLVFKYSLYYTKKDNLKRSAVPLTTRLAATFWHGDNQLLKIGDQLTLFSSVKGFSVLAKVIRINENLDTIILEADNDICDKDLISDAVVAHRGTPYLLMGFSVYHDNTNHMSLSSGVIVSEITPRLRYIGLSGSFKGDSGGSCWTSGGRLIGMQVEVENVKNKKDKYGNFVSPASGGRCGIVPIVFINNFILDLVPTGRTECDVEE